jgi:hypothetical protein
MGRSSSPVEAAVYVRHVLGLPVGKDREETPAQAAARREKLLAMQRESELRQEEVDKAEAAARERLLAYARDLYAGGKPAAGTIVQTYLRSRGITCFPGTLRLVKHCDLPAMCMPFGIPAELEPGCLSIAPTQIGGVHLTFLKADGSGKAMDAKGRSKIMVGRGHDFPLVLAPVNDLGGLVIAEGIEDGLMAHLTTALGAWAAGAAVRLPGVARHVPAYVEAVTLIEDDNQAGRDGCRALASALYERGIEVLIERGGLRHVA